MKIPINNFLVLMTSTENQKYNENKSQITIDLKDCEGKIKTF